MDVSAEPDHKGHVSRVPTTRDIPAKPNQEDMSAESRPQGTSRYRADHKVHVSRARPQRTSQQSADHKRYLGRARSQRTFCQDPDHKEHLSRTQTIRRRQTTKDNSAGSRSQGTFRQSQNKKDICRNPDRKVQIIRDISTEPHYKKTKKQKSSDSGQERTSRQKQDHRG